MINYTTFDTHLMNQIKNTYKPFGFAYAIYELDAGGPVRKAHNESGDRNQHKDAMTINSVTEMDSMSKTITAISLLKMISLVPAVKSAHDSAQSTPSGSTEWTAWKNKVDGYLNHTLDGLLPPLSQTGINWNTLPAAKTITLKNLLLHTSGLSPNEGDDPASIEHALKHWTATTTSTVYANPNYDLFRYIIPVFANKYVAPQPLLLIDEAVWHFPFGPQLFELMIGALYAVLVEDNVMNIFPSSGRPGIQPWGQQVEFADQSGAHFWDIMNDVSPWSTLCGSWGWKMTADQYAKVIASVESGAVMPKEYWTLMTESADTYGYGYAIYSIASAFAPVQAIGSYYSHNGGDGTSPEIGGEGFWLTWGSLAMCFRVNSPFKGEYGMPSASASDQTLNYLFQAVDAALNAALS